MLHPGEGAAILAPIVGSSSVILLDEGAHMRQRKLVLPAFHSSRIAALEDLVAEICTERIAAWPTGEAAALHPRLQELTLEVIMRAVFGISSARRRAELAPCSGRCSTSAPARRASSRSCRWRRSGAGHGGVSCGSRARVDATALA